MKIYNNYLELIGNTPLVDLKKIKEAYGLTSNLIGKLEAYNPTGSVKDRIALAMIEDAEKQGKINKDTVIIEPTSGNTGIGLAFIAAAKGYKLILTMPETMSIERRKLVVAYGAEVVLTDGKLGMQGSIDKAIELAATYDSAFIPQQFNNLANPEYHFRTTGPEIYNDLDGDIDVVIAGVGTGGTISGVGKYLKSKNPNIEIIAVEPEASAVLSGGPKGPHKIQGIGAGFIPGAYDATVVDRVVQVSNEDAAAKTRELVKLEGILAGISSGAALSGALSVAKEYKNKNIVIILPDTGLRYLSTDLFE